MAVREGLLALLLSYSWMATCQSHKPSLDNIRIQYYQSTQDYQHAYALMKLLDQINHPNAVELAYRGATRAVLAKAGWNLFKKIQYLKQSRDDLQQAVGKDHYDLEVRFLRLSVEYHIPRYLGLSKNMDLDKQMIMDHMELFRIKDLPEEISNYIILFSTESGICSREEIERLKQTLLDG